MMRHGVVKFDIAPEHDLPFISGDVIIKHNIDL